MAYLREYLNQIQATYMAARKEYTRIMDNLDITEERFQRKMKSGELTPKGKEKAMEYHREDTTRFNRELEELLQKTETSFSEIRAAADQKFKGRYSIDPKMIDANTLELLKSGILTDNELKTFAKDFENNPTMRRMIGKYAKERADKDSGNMEMRSLAAACSVAEAPHLDVIDGLLVWCRSGLRADRRLSDNIAEKYEQGTANIFREFGDICSE